MVELEFCKVSQDLDLVEYNTIEEMLGAEFYPGNYTPTQDQAKQLIKAAALSAARWVKLKKILPLKEVLNNILEETGEPHTAKYINEVLNGPLV